METDDLESNNDKLVVDVPKEKRFLSTASYDYSVEFLVGLMSGDIPKIVLAVPFQRNFIWKEDRASQLIESVIMNVPIPPLYFAEEESGRWLIIDGLQRLNSLLRFSQNEFALEGLEIIKELEGLKYKDLSPKSKDLLNDGLMRINVIKKDSHSDIKYDIFMRLNKGSVTLNYQELRNCLYRGNLNDGVKRFVAENKSFQRILKLKKAHPRFLDAEFVMRIFSLQEKLRKNAEGNFYIEDYNGRMVNFINDFMKRTSDMSSEDAEKLIKEYELTIKKAIAVFGEILAFKDPYSKGLRFNKAVGELISISFRNYDIDLLSKKKSEIIALLAKLLKENEGFGKSISQKTSDTDVVNFRINLWLKELANAV